MSELVVEDSELPRLPGAIGREVIASGTRVRLIMLDGSDRVVQFPTLEAAVENRHRERVKDVGLFRSNTRSARRFRCSASSPVVRTALKRSIVLVMATGPIAIEPLDAAIFQLYKAGRISLEEALEHADSRTDLSLRIRLELGMQSAQGNDELSG